MAGLGSLVIELFANVSKFHSVMGLALRIAPVGAVVVRHWSLTMRYLILWLSAEMTSMTKRRKRTMCDSLRSYLTV